MSYIFWLFGFCLMETSLALLLLIKQIPLSCKDRIFLILSHLSCGVPQGLVLGPILCFYVFIYIYASMLWTHHVWSRCPSISAISIETKHHIAPILATPHKLHILLNWFKPFFIDYAMFYLLFFIWVWKSALCYFLSFCLFKPRLSIWGLFSHF